MRKRTEAERRQLVTECRASGKSQKAWCREKGIPYTTFANWRRRIQLSATIPEERSTQWADVTPPLKNSLNKTQPATVFTKKENIDEIFEIQSSPPVSSAAKILLKCGNFEIVVETDFNPKLMTDVLKVVSRICC